MHFFTLKNADFRVAFSFNCCVIDNYWLQASNCSLYILYTQSGYLKFRYQCSLYFNEVNVFIGIMYPYITLRFREKWLSSLLRPMLLRLWLTHGCTTNQTCLGWGAFKNTGSFLHQQDTMGYCGTTKLH